MIWQPHNYQKQAVEFCIDKACAGLLLDPGLGKTSIVYAAFNLLRRKGYAKRMLVIAPLRPAYQVWPAEARRWDQFQHLKVNVLHGSKKLDRLREKADVDVINPEGLRWLFRQNLRASPREPWPWDMLVVDESTRFKHVGTDRFRCLRPYLPEFGRRYILTGSPAPNGLLDLFGQVFLLDLGNALGQHIGQYKTQWFDPSGYMGYQWVLKKGADQAIYRRLKPLVLRMDAKDLLELPPLIYNRVEVELPPAARKVYEEMERTLVTMLQNDVITAANAAVATNKCRQIANGGIFHADGTNWTQIHEAKVDAVEEIIEELQGKPALVAYEYQHDLARLRARFPEAPFIGGGVAPKRFKEIEAAWNRGDIPVLLAQPQSVAHGLNLQGTRGDVIFAGETWNLEDREQLIRRVWRQGQTERVVVHDIVALHTVDEAVLRAIHSKDRTQRGLLDALKTHLRRSR